MFGSKKHDSGMSFKTKFILITSAALIIYAFRGQILAHFGIEMDETAKTPAKVEQQAPGIFPERVMTVQSTTVFQEPGRNPYATIGAGQPVSILDEQDTGQSFITVRHNGMTGYVARRDLRIGNNK